MRTIHRLTAALAAALLALPPAARAEEAAKTAPVKSKPVVWYALRSFERVEQRLKEFTKLAKAQGIDEMALGLIRMRFGGLGGLDKTRPIVIASATLDTEGDLKPVLALPYADKDAALATLQTVVPGVEEKGGFLRSAEGEEPFAARFDAPTTCLLIGPNPESIEAVDLRVPADLFPTEGGPDFLVRLDAEEAARRDGSGWKKVGEKLADALQEGIAKVESEAKTEAAKELGKAFLDMYFKALAQSLDDLSAAEVRLTLAPAGWLFEVESRAKPGTPTAAFLAAQAARPSRAAALLPDAYVARGFVGIHATDDVRKAVRTLLDQGRKAAEAEIAGDAALSEDDRKAKSDLVGMAFPLLEQWLTQADVEMAFECGTAAKELEATLWTPVPAAAKTAGALLDLIEKGASLKGGKTPEIARDAEKHGDTAIHRLKPEEKPDAKGPKMESVYLAGEGDLLVLQGGSTSDPLKGTLDRSRAAGGTRPAAAPAVMRLEFSMSAFARSGLIEKGEKPPDAFGRKLLAKLGQAKDTPFVLELLAAREASTLRLAVPASFIQAVAELAGEQMHKQMRGGPPGDAPPGGDEK